MPSIFELAPARKAKQSVSEVIVMDGPACLRASIKRSCLDNLSEL